MDSGIIQKRLKPLICHDCQHKGKFNEHLHISSDIFFRNNVPNTLTTATPDASTS